MNNPTPAPSLPTIKKDPGSFGKKDTDLGKFSHGNFDVEYRPDKAELMTTFRAKYEFESGIPVHQITEFKNGMLQAIDVWDNSGVFLWTRNRQALNQSIALRFQLVESSDYNKVVDVQKDSMRPFVFVDLNISIDWRFDIETLAHELGHVFGNYDEYGGTGFMGWLERRMWWHDNDHLDDTNALMNGGMEFRKRYFDHYLEYVNDHFKDLGIQYELAQGARSEVRASRVARKRWVRSGVNLGFLPDEGGPHELRGPIRFGKRETIRFYLKS